MELILLQYNNYINRRLKKESSISDYYQNANRYFIIDDYDFNPNDGVDTQAVLGGEHYDYEDIYDYMLVTDGNELLSRWFIIDANRTRTGQYQLTLHRDVVADNWDEIKTAPAFIEKATLSDSDPLIYNSENMSVNQIKTSETLIKDKTDVAWICGYVKRTDPQQADEKRIEFQGYYKPDLVIESNTEDWNYYKYATSSQQHIGCNSHIDNMLFLSMNVDYQEQVNSIVYDSSIGQASPSSWYNLWNVTEYCDYRLHYLYTIPWSRTGMYQYINDYEWDYLLLNSEVKTYRSATDNVADYNYLKSLDGKVLKFNDGMYKVKVNKSNNKHLHHVEPNVYTVYDIGTHITGILNSKPRSDIFEQLHSPYVASVYELYSTITITLEPIQDKTYQIRIQRDDYRYHLKDSVYDMFCIPYPVDKEYVTIKNSSITDSSEPDYFEEFNMYPLYSMQLAQGIAAGLSDKIVDIQILPYCPVSIDVGPDKVLDLKTPTSGAYVEGKYTQPRYSICKPTTAPQNEVGIIIWALASKGTINSSDIQFNNIEVNNKKINAECDMYRLCSGNYASSFELNIAKNGGIKNISVDYTYLPYNSYIHVNPVFENLYGQDFNDCRGLIDQSDKSISYASSGWESYQISNKTYQQQFSREIILTQNQLVKIVSVLRNQYNNRQLDMLETP